MQQELVARNWRELIRPRQIENETSDQSDRYGKFSCEPLERGFGTTLGNALRRVLLSSLQGSAIKTLESRSVPQWVEINKEAFEGTVKQLPVRDDITMPIQEQLIVELYSR